MGLDAVVYLRPESSATSSSDDTAAIHKRLGNVSAIGWLAEEILPVVGEESILLRKVLYSGSHSGDSIALEDLERLESEIKLVRDSMTTGPPRLESFLQDMSDLISKARDEAMPIVFV